jgi:ABC-2 type transport system permease protein
MNVFFFELRYWLRQPMVYVFLVINTLLIFGATSSDTIQVGGSFGNITKNAPFVIQSYYSVMSYITLLMTTAFVLASTTRDFTYNSFQIIFTTPIHRYQYLLGRLCGAVIIAVIPMIGVSLGVLSGSVMPWVDAAKVGPVYPMAHLSGFFFIAIPNTLFGASVVFMIAALTRNTIASFVGSLVLLVVVGVAGAFAQDLDKEWIAALVDPFGAQTFSLLTKYWTVGQKNQEILSLTGWFLANRLIWIFISILLIGITLARFSFTEVSRKRKKKIEEVDYVISHLHLQDLPVARQKFNISSTWYIFWVKFRFELTGILKSPAFIVILLAGLLNFIPNILINNEPYGLSAYPVTYSMIDMIEGSFYMFLVAIIIIYSGQLVWKEREHFIDEIHDAAPHPHRAVYMAKFSALAVVILVVQLGLIAACVSTQLAKGFYDVRLPVYFKSLLMIDYPGLLLLIVMAMFFHSVINNKYLAFFAFVIFLIANSFIWFLLDVESLMVRYGGRPTYIYSDMNGFGPFWNGMVWFRVYWLLFAMMLVFLTIFIWTRGKEFSIRHKLSRIREGLKSPSRLALAWIFIAWLFCGTWIYYNTQVLNEIVTSDELEKLQVDYEKKYKQYQDIFQPRITDIKYKIDLYPNERKLDVRGVWWVKNKSLTPLDSIHISFPRYFRTAIEIPGSQQVHNDEQLRYRIFRLHSPLPPGDSMRITFTSTYEAEGFENQVSFTSVVENGSFFNNTDISPNIGYMSERELTDRDKRRKHGLGDRDRMPLLQMNCTEACMNNYISSNADWVQVETVISTSGDQLAIAPGSLRREWKKEGRNFYQYKLDHPSVNFYSFMSGRYEVLREKYRDIDVEVYYDSRHAYNIGKMERSMKRSLDYFLEHFGPYYHKQVRIIEFPRYGSFAQAFPGTMPYSESIGFIARIVEEDDIDMVFYVVAHEMAHQYWAHQVIGAYMQGATLLSETFSQYSALMVMEKEYGRDAMKKFLKYEMDAYLRSRGSEWLKEQPLKTVEDQGYVHYRKGSVVMYYLKEMIGEMTVNEALRELIEQYAYKNPPYPTSEHAINAFKTRTPDSLQYLITDLFEKITVFNNRVTDVQVNLVPGGKYELVLDAEVHKYYADSVGIETEVPVNDWIEIGVFGEEGPRNKNKPVIYRKKHLIKENRVRVPILLDKKPEEAGIDPMNLLVDLVSDDNIKQVVVPSAK